MAKWIDLGRVRFVDTDGVVPLDLLGCWVRLLHAIFDEPEPSAARNRKRGRP